MRLLTLTGLSALALVGTALLARDARACGGTFCDSGPQAMPVDQSGENILFVMDGQNVEAHVQIQYQGSAERFAWVVPMPKVPEVTVGSQLLFQNMLQGTVPTYGYNNQFDQCGAPSNGGGGFAGGSGSGGAAGGSSLDAGGGPTVVFKETVGAFEVTALQGGTAQEVMNWLVTNNYQTIPTAVSILDDYVKQGYVFVAVKLTAGASTDEIHPLVFRYPGNEPCVPLKLTAVAATENMGVRTFFLGDDRVVPTNYKHVVLNPVRIDWQAFGANYEMSVTRGADSAVANGRAFVTDYAGSSSVVSPAGVYSPAWNNTTFLTSTPETVVDDLTKQGLMFCSGSSCQYNHPLLVPLLNEYVPVPAGLQQDTFYSCISCYATQVDQTAWSAPGFAADFKARIEDPGKHASNILTTYPYLTRMFTTISPSEMTEDPMFHARPGLPPVSRVNQGTLRRTCSGAQGMILPDGRQVALDAGAWPAWDSAMPWAEKIEEYVEGGDAITLVDNSAIIDDQLAAWNAKHSWPPAGNGVGSGGFTGGTGGGSNGAGTDDAGISGGGCACGVAGGAGSSGLLGAGLLLGLAAVARRLRRRRARAQQ